MRWSLFLIATFLTTILAKPLPSDNFGDHVKASRSLPAGALVMDAETIAATDWGDIEPVVYVPAPAHTLTPSIHHDHDTSNVSHLEPQYQKALYFAQGKPHSKPYQAAKFLHADTHFKYPAVVLEQSCHAKASISGTRMTIKFIKEEAFERMRSSWMGASAQHPIILITTTGSKDGHLVYYLITNVECFDHTWTCVLEANEANFDDLLESSTMTWGHVDHPLAKRAPLKEPFLKTRQSALTFDQQLDADAGYIQWQPSTFAKQLKSFAPGLSNTDWNSYNDLNEDNDGLYGGDNFIDVDDSLADYYDSGAPVDTGSRRALFRRRLQRRGLFDRIRGAIDKKIIGPISQAAQQVKNTVVSAANTYVIQPIQQAVSYVDGTPHGFVTDKSFQAPTAADMTEANKYISLPFWTDETGNTRSARQLYAYDKNNLVFEVYCVDCGVTANVEFSGTVAFNIVQGLTQANLRVTGNVVAGVGIGLVAQYTNQYDTQKRLFTTGIPGLSVPNFISLGPLLTVDAVYGWNLDAQGTFLAGGKLSLNNIDATIDIINSGNSKRPNLNPQFQHYWQANTEITANVYAGVTAGLAVGLDIANGKATASGAIQSEPKISAQFVASAYAGTSPNPSNPCTGLGLTLDVEHSLYAVAKYKLPLLGEKDTPRYKFTNDYNINFPQQCYAATNTKRQVSPAESSQIGDPTLYSDFNPQPVNLNQEPVDTVPDGLEPFTNSDQQDYTWPAPIAAMFTGNSPDDASPSYNDDSNAQDTGFNYSIIWDSGLQYFLATTDDGNVGLQPLDDYTTGENLFQIYQDMVVADSFGRTLVYYPGEVQNYQVSRLRVVSSDKIPLSSATIALVPFALGDTMSSIDGTVPQAFLYGLDTVGNLFWVVKCDYSDTTINSQLFLIADPATGAQTLTDPNLVPVLTGSDIASCQSVGLLTGATGY